jgi:hypothetical protein
VVVATPIALAIHVLLTADVDGAPRPRSLLDPIPGLKRPPPEEVYQLREAKDGTGELVYDESGFTARVAQDGSVRFIVKRERSLHLFPPLPKRKSIHLGVPSLQSSLNAALQGHTPSAPRPPDDGSPPPETTMVIPEVSRYRPDPREGCRYCGMFPPVYPNVTWRVDVTDELMRMSGQDPYRYQKAKFLVATTDLRSRMGAKTHAENIRDAITELPARLVSIACDERLSPRDRRAILEALRAELDAGTPAGRLAAGRIETFLTARFGQPETCAPISPAAEPAPP